MTSACNSFVPTLTHQWSLFFHSAVPHSLGSCALHCVWRVQSQNSICLALQSGRTQHPVCNSSPSCSAFALPPGLVAMSGQGTEQGPGDQQPGCFCCRGTAMPLSQWGCTSTAQLSRSWQLPVGLLARSTVQVSAPLMPAAQKAPRPQLPRRSPIPGCPCQLQQMPVLPWRAIS